jgi:energy-coupling factor transporter transmembrane protein EcfT
MMKRGLIDISVGIIFTSIVGFLAVIYVVLGYPSVPAIAVLVVIDLCSFVHQKVRLRWVLVVLGMPLLIVGAKLLATQVSIWEAPHPTWTADGATWKNSGELAQCAELVSPVPDQPVERVNDEQTAGISRHEASKIANLMILQVDWMYNPANASGSLTWYPSLLQLTLVTAMFPDGEKRLAWYAPIETNVGYHGSSAVLAIAYIDAQSGKPLMLITGMSVRLIPGDYAKPNGCPPLAENTDLQDWIVQQYWAAFLLVAYLWLVMLMNWIKR